MNPIQPPCPAASFMPHKPPMRLVATLLERDETSLVEATVPAEGIWLNSMGEVLPEYYIELVAQALAVINGYDAHQAGKVAEDGMLVGVDEFTLERPPVPGEEVRVAVKENFAFGAVKIVEGTVSDTQGKLAGVKLKIWSGDLRGQAS